MTQTHEIGLHSCQLCDTVAQESSACWNNAGTGHSALCELNYTPEAPCVFGGGDTGSSTSINITKAVDIAEQFQLSRQLWSKMIEDGDISGDFINKTPHMSFCWDSNVDFLKRRHELMEKQPLFRGMEYTEDEKKIAEC